jgi:hypothetical protein
MKKVVRMLGLCALVALAFTACKKNDTQKVTFTGYAVQPTSDVRTHISDGTFLVWSENDQIKVFNEAGDDMDFTVQSSAGKPGVAVFAATTADEVAFVADLETAEYAAFYPNAVVNEDDKVVMAIPAEQEYFSGKEIANNLYPMVGFNNGTDNFDFVSNAGFLNVRFQVSNDSEIDTYTIDKIVLRSKANDDFLTGNFIYEKDGSGVDFEGTGNVVTLTGDPTTIIKGYAIDFTFVLPEGALWSGFDVELYNGDEFVESFEGQGNEVNSIVAEQFRAMVTAWLPRPVPAPSK